MCGQYWNDENVTKTDICHGLHATSAFAETTTRYDQSAETALVAPNQMPATSRQMPAMSREAKLPMCWSGARWVVCRRATRRAPLGVQCAADAAAPASPPPRSGLVIQINVINAMKIAADR
ncbi:hypothetical protein SAMN04487768_0881 [Burkholderia sp. b13]|nr:hypothetical protein SAMN04487768_0881 [Burkholderia sp. b13]